MISRLECQRFLFGFILKSLTSKAFMMNAGDVAGAHPGEDVEYRDTSLMRKSSPPQDHHRALDVGLL